MGHCSIIVWFYFPWNQMTNPSQEQLFGNQGTGMIWWSDESRFFEASSYPNSTSIEHYRRQKKRKGQNIWKKEEKKLLVPEKHTWIIQFTIRTESLVFLPAAATMSICLGKVNTILTARLTEKKWLFHYILSVCYGNKGIAKWLQGNDGLVEFPGKLFEGS